MAGKIKIGGKRRKVIIGRFKIGQTTEVLNTPTYEYKARQVTTTWTGVARQASNTWSNK